MAITLGTDDPIHVNIDANSAINVRTTNANDIPGPPAFAWATLVSSASLTCLPCLRHVPSDDSLNNQGGHHATNRDPRTYNQHTPYNSAINTIPRARPDELQGLLIPTSSSSSSSSFPFGSSSHAGEGDAAYDTDALSLHSNIGASSSSRKNRHRRRRSKGKSGGLKKISFFGWNLFGVGSRSGRIRLPDDDNENLSGGPARIERTKSAQSAQSERSTLTFDSDAAPLSASVIDELGASASTSLVPPPGELVDLPPSASHGSMEAPPPSELVDFSSPTKPSRSSLPDIQASDDEPNEFLSPGSSDQLQKSRKPRKSSAHKEQRAARARLERLKSQGILPESGNGEEFEGFQGSGSAAPPVVPRTSRASRSSWTSGSEGTSEGRASVLKEDRRRGLEDADRRRDERSGGRDGRKNGKPHPSMVAALLTRRSAATPSSSSTSDLGRYASAVGSGRRGVGSHPVSPDLMAPLSPQTHEHSPTDFDVITADDYEGHREEGEDEADLGGGMYVSGARRRGYGGSAGRSQGSGSGSGFKGDGGSQGRHGGDDDIGGSHGSPVGEGGSTRAGRNETQGVYQGGDILQPRTILSEVPHTKKKSKKASSSVSRTRTSTSASRSVASSGSAGRTYSAGVTSPLATSSSASFPHRREPPLYTQEDEFQERQGPLRDMASSSTVEKGLGFFDAEDLVPAPPAAKQKHGPRKSGRQKRAGTATSMPATPAFEGFQLGDEEFEEFQARGGGSDELADMGIPPPPKTQIGTRGDFPIVGFGGRARGFSTGAAGVGGPTVEAGSMRRFGGGASGGGERAAAKFLANTGEID